MITSLTNGFPRSVVIPGKASLWNAFEQSLSLDRLTNWSLWWCQMVHIWSMISANRCDIACVSLLKIVHDMHGTHVHLLAFWRIFILEWRMWKKYSLPAFIVINYQCQRMYKLYTFKHRQNRYTKKSSDMHNLTLINSSTKTQHPKIYFALRGNSVKFFSTMTPE